MSGDSITRVALVTGASKGIGLVIAECLYLSGMNVVICSRSKADIDDVIGGLYEKHSAKNIVGTINGYSCDVTDELLVEQLVDNISRKFSRLDVLVNNCGGLSKDNTGVFEDLSPAQWLECLNTNLMSAVLLNKYCYPLLKKSKSGRVVTISSLVAVQPGVFNPHYSAAKAALLALSKNLSMRWAEDGILVNAVSPGIIETQSWNEFIANKSGQTGQAVYEAAQQQLERAISNVPLSKLGTCEDVARCVEFLSSDNNTYITGENIIIDGGKNRAI